VAASRIRGVRKPWPRKGTRAIGQSLIEIIPSGKTSFVIASQMNEYWILGHSTLGANVFLQKNGG
jgi:hypothetical protein